MKKDKKTSKTSLVIMINIPDVNARRGEGTAAIQKGDLGTILQFPFNGLTLKGDLAQAVHLVLKQLAEVELKPPPLISSTDSAPIPNNSLPVASDEDDLDDDLDDEETATTENEADSMDEIVGDADDDAALEETAVTDSLPDPDDSPILGTPDEATRTILETHALTSEETSSVRVKSFCGVCGTPHLAIFSAATDSGMVFAPDDDAFRRIDHCFRCGEGLEETSIALEASIARQQFPLEEIYIGHELPTLENSQIEQSAVTHATTPHLTFNTLYLHNLPLEQANFYIECYQKALADDSPTPIPPVSVSQNLKKSSPTTPKEAKKPGSTAQMALF